MVIEADRETISKLLFDAIQVKLYLRHPNNNLYTFKENSVPTLDTFIIETIEAYDPRCCKLGQRIKKR